MTSKFNYIKRSTKYIIGTAILATSLSSAAFGLGKDGESLDTDKKIGHQEILMTPEGSMPDARPETPVTDARPETPVTDVRPKGSVPDVRSEDSMLCAQPKRRWTNGLSEGSVLPETHGVSMSPVSFLLKPPPHY